jgi:aspartate racemase
MIVQDLRSPCKPVIGLLGGCGPHATLDIERKIISATCSMRAPVNDQDYYPMVVSYMTQLQDRSQTTKGDADNLISQLNSSIEQLISIKSDILLLACQSAHVFLNKSHPLLDKVLFVSMIDVTIMQILSHPMKWKRIGLLGTDVLYGSNLYQTPLESKGVKVITPQRSLQKHVMQAIYTIKIHGVDFLNSIKGSSAYNNRKINSTNQILSRVSEDLTFAVHYITDAINYLLDQNVDRIILGCTELPLLLPSLTSKFSEDILIDPNQLVAEKVVQYACEMEKKDTEKP